MNALVYPYKLSKALSFAPPKMNQKLWLLIGFIFLMITASIFFWQNSQVMSKTYQLQHLQERLTDLKKENQSLETSAIKENSLFNLEELVKNLGLEKIQNITFIQSLGNSVVAR